MPFEYTDLEEEIAARITAHIAATSSLTEKVVAQALPDNKDEFIEADEKDRITVYVFSATGSPSTSTNERVVNEEIIISCNIQSRTRKGNADFPGCNGLAKVLKELLTGFQPTHCSRLSWKSYQGSNPVRDDDKGFWSYDVDFSTTKLFVQVLDDESDPAAPLLKEVEFIDQIEL